MELHPRAQERPQAPWLLVVAIACWVAGGPTRPARAAWEPTPITGGLVIDGAPASVEDPDGELLVAFERRPSEGTETDAGLYFVKSPDGREFSEPEVLIDLPGSNETSPTLLRADLVLFCYFVSDTTGMPRIHVARRGPGEPWVMGPRPLDLGFRELPQVHPSAVRLPGDFESALLAFEVQERDQSSVHVQELSGYLMASGPSVEIGAGRRPDLLRAVDGRVLVVREPHDVLVGTLVNVSDDGESWSSDFPSVAEELLGSPELVQLPSGAISLMAETLERSPPTFVRTYESTSGVFEPPRLVPTGPLSIQEPMTAVLSSGEALTYGVMPNMDGTAHLVLTEIGTCSERPFFGGLGTIVDPEPCSPSELVLNWTEPLSWGSGTEGEYEVHRSPSPDFPVDLVELIAVTTELSLTVPATPEPAWYRVRARAVEACWADELDPDAAWGLTDTNDTVVEGVDAIVDGEPLEASGLQLGRGSGVGLLNWALQDDAAGYRIYSSGRPDTGFIELTTEPVAPPQLVTFGDDDPDIVFYLIRAESACGILGP